MQHSLSLNLQTGSAILLRLPYQTFLPLRTAIIGLAALIGTTLISGCESDSNRSETPAKIFTGVSLTIRCPSGAFLDVLTPAARSWAERTGAKLSLSAEPMTANDATDIGIIDVADFGFWAERGELTSVPASLRAADNPFQWTGLLPAYREQLIEWGGQARAIPLAGDGFVIVYRADRLKDPQVIAEFQAQFARLPSVPATWEEFADLAAVLAKVDGKPSLPSLSPSELANLFFQNAACHDRIAQTEAVNSRQAGGLGGLSFQFDLATGEPRLATPAFQAAASWLADLAAKKCLMPASEVGTDDPAAQLASNGASLGILSLAQLARLPRERRGIPERFALAPLPGTRTVFDAEKQKLVSRPIPNYLPYFGGGRLGVVRTRCANPNAAFELLAELGGPTRSLEIVSASALGVGPFRIAHLDHERMQIWYGYGFDAERTDTLRKALLHNVNFEAKNPTYELRGPDRLPLSAAVAKAMGKIAVGTPPERGLKELLEEWKAVDVKIPPETRLKWRKLAAGLVN